MSHTPSFEEFQRHCRTANPNIVCKETGVLFGRIEGSYFLALSGDKQRRMYRSLKRHAEGMRQLKS